MYTVAGLSKFCIDLKSCFKCKPGLWPLWTIHAIDHLKKNPKSTENYACVFPAGNRTLVKLLDLQAMVTLPHLYLVKYALRYMLLR